jgi:hypothetical protein
MDSRMNRDDPVVAYLKLWEPELTAHEGDAEDFSKAIAIAEQKWKVIEAAKESFRQRSPEYDDEYESHLRKELAALDKLENAK